jgi:FdhD protein
MKETAKNKEIAECKVLRVSGSEVCETSDLLSVEEPLEIRVSRLVAEKAITQQIAVTMRTPGEDVELAIGFLLTEGVLSAINDVKEVKTIGCNVIDVVLANHVEVDESIFARHSFVASSCGVCGKRSIEAVKTRRNYRADKPFPKVDANIINSLPEKLRSIQKSFSTTGGIHASGLFDLDGELLMLREDVGRHNALDKLIGACAQQLLLPLDRNIILFSGRASFELVQKAAHAGATILAAVGAPSSLAVQLAEESGVTLLGFVRDRRFNVYTGINSIQTEQFCASSKP